jgi:nitrogen fixation/metabolism regulation signal transduction histidine kinase
MARQIAHEINNPLTPMKLSVQHLLRARKDKSEKFDEYLERIAETLIEEIDNLSSIATEFSNFAKMPQAHYLRFNLVDKINTVVNLFSNAEADFVLNYNNNENAEVFADKEQISRVFINLFKNAIQAVDKNIHPLIKITINVENEKVIVKVNDNGNGIPEEMREKLFRPNFTTKSSGMGLGLAIIKNIMEDIGGGIRFITETGKGTTFILEFPMYKDKKLLW